MLPNGLSSAEVSACFDSSESVARWSCLHLGSVPTLIVQKVLPNGLSSAGVSAYFDNSESVANVELDAKYFIPAV